MAVNIKFSEGKKSKPSAKTAKKAAKGLEVTIPDEPSVPCDDFRSYSMLVHGEKKIGKTTLFAQEEGVFFMEFDPEQIALAIRQRHVPDWPHTLAYIDQLEQGPKAIKTVVCDDAGLMYQHCFNWCCEQMCIEHPTDEKDFGKSWGFIRDEYERAIHRLLNLPTVAGIAPRFICHSKWKEFKDREGTKTEKLVPTLTGQAEEALVGEIDIWAAYTYWGKQRVLVIKGDEIIGAGHRVDHRFRTPFDGQPVNEIWMGNSPQESYRNLLTAFNNLQRYEDMAQWRQLQERKVQKIKPKIKIGH
jgi:hypothetical protein